MEMCFHCLRVRCRIDPDKTNVRTKLWLKRPHLCLYIFFIRFSFFKTLIRGGNASKLTAGLSPLPPPIPPSLRYKPSFQRSAIYQTDSCFPQTRLMTLRVPSSTMWRKTRCTSHGRSRRPPMGWSSCTRSTTRDTETRRWRRASPARHISRAFIPLPFRGMMVRVTNTQVHCQFNTPQPPQQHVCVFKMSLFVIIHPSFVRHSNICWNAEVYWNNNVVPASPASFTEN